MDFADAIHLYGDGEIDFNRFVRLTTPAWRRIATSLHARFRAPAVDVEDLVQIMLLDVYTSQRAQKWTADGRLGSRLHYTTWDARVKAKRHLLRMRGSKLSTDGPVRYTFSEYKETPCADATWIVDGKLDAEKYAASDHHRRLIQHVLSGRPLAELDLNCSYSTVLRIVRKLTARAA